MRDDNKYLEITHLSKGFPAPSGGTPTMVVKDFDLSIRKGEFLCLIGHSGCGKSTVLSIVAGLTKATEGGVILDGREVREPGTDRGVVFQAPCLLPWMTAFENVMLAVEQAWPDMAHKRRALIVEHHLRMVGLEDAMHKRPAELSAGMRQRVGLARAFSLSPKVLLLDEPFGMLDSLTRYELNQVLLDLWSAADEAPEAGAAANGTSGRRTALMVTHDVDEAIFLSDRVAMMTSGPEARLGGILEIPFPRPRDRAALLENPRYYEVREQLIGFLNSQEHPAPPPTDDESAVPVAAPAPAPIPAEAPTAPMRAARLDAPAA